MRFVGIYDLSGVVILTIYVRLLTVYDMCLFDYKIIAKKYLSHFALFI